MAYILIAIFLPPTFLFENKEFVGFSQAFETRAACEEELLKIHELKINDPRFVAFCRGVRIGAPS